LIDACAQMAADGYTIALDDFVYLPELEPLIAMASIIKFDFRLSSKAAIDGYVEAAFQEQPVPAGGESGDPRRI
jgi:c-di-GMP-related signal transduction protein